MQRSRREIIHEIYIWAYNHTRDLCPGCDRQSQNPDEHVCNFPSLIDRRSLLAFLRDMSNEDMVILTMPLIELMVLHHRNQLERQRLRQTTPQPQIPPPTPQPQIEPASREID